MEKSDASLAIGSKDACFVSANGLVAPCGLLTRLVVGVCHGGDSAHLRQKVAERFEQAILVEVRIEEMFGSD